MEPTDAEEYRGADLLSKLPCDVLVSILEKLDLRDAIRAGVLSSRWRCLPNQLPRLALDINDFLPGGGDEEYDDHDNGEDLAPSAAAVDDGYRDVLSEAGNKMVDVAAALLLASARAAGDVDVRQAATLAVSFHLRHGYHMSLGRLIDDAVVSGKVRAAELKITTKTRMVGTQDRESTEDALLRGYGRRFRTLFDACPAAFGALTKVAIKNVKLCKPDLDDILHTCTRLEELSLFYCLPGPGGVWQVRHAQLTDMRISLCGIRGVNLEWLPRLDRFAFQGWYSTSHELVSFGHVPRLTTVTLSHEGIKGDKALKLSRILPNTALKELRLNFRGSNIWVQPETSIRLTDVFGNLKNLKIRNVHRECGLSWTMFLLPNAPHLQELYIKLTDHECGVALKNVPWKVATSSFKHYSLTRVTILGFYSAEETIVAYIRRLVEAAVNLKEMYMRENATFCAICGHAEPLAGSRFPRTDGEKETFTKRITNGRSTTFIPCIQS